MPLNVRIIPLNSPLVIALFTHDDVRAINNKYPKFATDLFKAIATTYFDIALQVRNAVQPRGFPTP